MAIRSVAWRSVVVLLTVFVLVSPLAQAQSLATSRPEPPLLTPARLRALLPELRAGGMVIFLRHVTTRADQEDRVEPDLADCATQRNLSDAGRREAEAIGAAWRALGIPVGRVVASPFCRTRETARLAFGESITVSSDLYFAIGLAPQERLAISAALRRMLGEMPREGHNTVLVSHTVNLQEAVGVWPKPEGVAVLARPDGRGGHRLVGRVEPQTWVLVANGSARP